MRWLAETSIERRSRSGQRNRHYSKFSPDVNAQVAPQVRAVQETFCGCPSVNNTPESMSTSLCQTCFTNHRPNAQDLVMPRSDVLLVS